METKVKAKYGLPSIDGIVCTYETKKIRAQIESFFQENRVFILPDRYIYKIMPSKFWGKVAKIGYKKKLN